MGELVAQTTQTRKILIKVDTSDAKGLRELADKMGMLNKSTKSLANTFGTLTNAIQGWIAYLGVRELARMSDEVQNLTSRLRITAREGESTAETFQKIVQLADANRISIQAAGDAYNRFAISLQRTGANAEEVLALTDTLIKTFRVSGSTQAETAATMVQLSQAFSSGTLRGQELRSVIEQNGVLAGYLRKEFGADLFKKAEQGAIKVTDVLRILIKNQEELQQQAEKLSPTFEQTLTKSMNKLTVAVGQLNEQFGLSAKFAAVMDFAIENLASVVVVLGGAMATLAISYIPAMIAGFQKLRVAAIAFATSNPILLALTAITVAAGLVYTNFDKLSIMFRKVQANLYDMVAAIEGSLLPLREKLANLFGIDPEIARRTTKANVDYLRKQAKDIRDKIAADEKADQKKKATDPNAGLRSLLDKVGKGETGGKLQKIKEILGDINQELLNGEITVEEYNRKLVNFELYKLNREFKEGKFDIFTYNQRLKELNIQEFNRLLKNGALTFDEFNNAVKKANIEELTAKFEAGKISLAEYNSELIKMSDKFEPGSSIFVGVNNYITSVGTLSTNIATAITNTFTRLEDNLLEFTKTGEFNFAKFTSAILEDIQRIIIRMAILKPIANSIAGAFAGGSTQGNVPAGGTDGAANYSGYAAKGMAFYGGVRKFASGGIVNSPTAFTYNGGRRGLMGEAGTEAIMPLQRASNGDLGVAASVTPVTVNIFNQNGSDVQQTESTGPNGERSLDIFITSKVNEAISTGKTDKAIKAAYGLNRRGN